MAKWSVPEKIFRRVGLRSIGLSSQKLWPNQIFGRFPHCNYNVKLKVVATADLWNYNAENFCVLFFNQVIFIFHIWGGKIKKFFLGLTNVHNQAALGGTIRVQGIYEDINLQIPPGTPSHTRCQIKQYGDGSVSLALSICWNSSGQHCRMRMEKKGIKKVSGFGHGDHYINIKVISWVRCARKLQYV